MAFESLGTGALDYLPCRYGTSKVLFRGPKRHLDEPYLAMLGGIETYGKFVEHPYPALLEQELGLTAANFGCANAGIDAFVDDQTILQMCNASFATVIQLPGAQNISNRFYAVHPRRNDRFLRASGILKALYRDVDFTEINFTRHLLKTLHESSVERFEIVQTELQEAWVGRMKTMISRIEGKIVLLWLSDHGIADGGKEGIHGTDPMFVTQSMIDEISPFVHEVAEVVVSADEILEGQQDLIYSEMDAPAAQQMLGTIAQKEAAMALTEILSELV